MAYSKQTWDTTSYVNPTRMNHIEDGIEGVSNEIDNLDAEDVAYDSNTSVSDMLTPQAITVTPNSTYVNTTSGNYVMAVHQIGKLVVVNIGLVKYKADVPNANNPMFTGLPPAKEIVEPVFSSNYRMRIEKGEGILRDWYNSGITTNYQFWGSFSYICE